MSYTPRLKHTYHNDVVPAMVSKFGYKNPMQVPRILKVALNQALVRLYPTRNWWMQL